MMRRRSLRLAPVALLLVPAALAGQWSVDLKRPRGLLGASYDGSWLNTDTEASRGQSRQWGQVDLGAILLTPRDRPWLRLSLSVRPQLGQGWVKPDPVQADLDQDGLAGSATLAFTPGRLVGVTGRVASSSLFQPDAFGGFQQTDRREWSAEVQDRNPLLPVTLSYSDRDESLVFASGIGGPALAMDRRVRDLRYQATNWKTKLLFHQLQVDEASRGRAGGYLQRLGQAQHTFRWGKGSRMDNRVRYFTRARDESTSALGLSSTARLQQTERIASELEWIGQRDAGDGWRRRSDRIRARGAYEWPGGSGAWIEVQRESERLGAFRRRDLRVAPRVTVVRAFSEGIRLSGNVDAGYTWTRTQYGEDTFGYVLEERQLFGPDGRIQLTRPFADPGSLTLVAADGTLLEEGLDYRVQVEGPFVVIFALPGGRIQEGSEVLADYRYEVPAQAGTRALDLRASATLHVGGASLLYRRNLRDDLGAVPVEGLPTLVDLDQQQLGLQYGLTRGRVGLNAYAGLEWVSVNQQTMKRWVANASVTTVITQSLRMSVRGRSTNSTGGRDFVASDSEARLTWSPWRALQSEVFASYFLWEDELRHDRMAGLGSAIRFQRGGTRASLRVDGVRRWMGTTRTERRIAVRIEQAVR